MCFQNLSTFFCPVYQLFIWQWFSIDCFSSLKKDFLDNIIIVRKETASNCWKCIEIVNHTITTLFLYLLRSHQADLFGSWGGGGGGRGHGVQCPAND